MLLSRHRHFSSTSCFPESTAYIAHCAMLHTHIIAHTVNTDKCSLPWVYRDICFCSRSCSTSESLLTSTASSTAPVLLSGYIYEIFISVLIVVFHSLSSEVNAVMLDYSINYAAVLLLFTEGTSTLEHFCLDPHRVCFELLIVFMSLTSSHSFPRTGPLAWLGMETARHWLDSQHTKLQPSAVFLWHLSKHSLTQRHCVCRCPSPFFCLKEHYSEYVIYAGPFIKLRDLHKGLNSSSQRSASDILSAALYSIPAYNAA